MFSGCEIHLSVLLETPHPRLKALSCQPPHIDSLLHSTHSTSTEAIPPRGNVNAPGSSSACRRRKHEAGLAKSTPIQAIQVPALTKGTSYTTCLILKPRLNNRRTSLDSVCHLAIRACGRIVECDWRLKIVANFNQPVHLRNSLKVLILSLFFFFLLLPVSCSSLASNLHSTMRLMAAPCFSDNIDTPLRPKLLWRSSENLKFLQSSFLG